MATREYKCTAPNCNFAFTFDDEKDTDHSLDLIRNHNRDFHPDRVGKENELAGIPGTPASSPAGNQTPAEIPSPVTPAGSDDVDVKTARMISLMMAETMKPITSAINALAENQKAVMLTLTNALQPQPAGGGQPPVPPQPPTVAYDPNAGNGGGDNSLGGLGGFLNGPIGKMLMNALMGGGGGSGGAPASTSANPLAQFSQAIEGIATMKEAMNRLTLADMEIDLTRKRDILEGFKIGSAAGLTPQETVDRMSKTVEGQIKQVQTAKAHLAPANPETPKAT